MEYWDLYTEDRQRTGRTHRRGNPLEEGTLHLVVSVWVVDRSGRFLLTLRSPDKELYPGFWENTAGSALAGETSRQAAVRELYEETGIGVDEGALRFLGTQKSRDAFVDLYLAVVDDPLPEIRLQPGETVDAKWVDAACLDRMMANGSVAKPVARRFAQSREAIGEMLGEPTVPRDA
jgi:isopentenyldiphosphate isomerase